MATTRAAAERAMTPTNRLTFSERYGHPFLPPGGRMGDELRPGRGGHAGGAGSRPGSAPGSRANSPSNSSRPLRTQ